MRSVGTLALVVLFCAVSDAYFHAGLLKVPEFDEIILYHLPPPASQNFRPLRREQDDEVHLFDLPKFYKPHGEAHREHEQPSRRGLQRMNSVSSRLFEADLKKLSTRGQEDEQESKQVKKEPCRNFHAGTWLVEQPADFVNLELEPIGYSRQWMGEERLGGCWSSSTDPLSGDRKYIIEGIEKMTLDDKEKEAMRGLGVTYDADGAAHVMPKKS